MRYDLALLTKVLKKIEILSLTDPTIAIQATRELWLNDFFLFAKYGLQYPDLEWDVHGEFIEVFESGATRKILVMPRGTFKSTLGSVAYPIWRLLKNPDLTILLDSEIYSNSKNFLREIKGHLMGERLTTYFGPLVGDKWDEGEIILKTRKRNRKEASITVGGIETTKVGQHYDMMIGDDYNSPSNSDSVEKCQKVIDHVRYNLNILNPGGEYVLLGTRYAERDVIGFFLKDVLGEPMLAEGKLELSKGLIKQSDELELGA